VLLPTGGRAVHTDEFSRPAPLVQPGPADRPGGDEAARLHLILLGDENDPAIGWNCTQDVDAVRRLFLQAFAGQPGRLVIHDLTGDAWSPSRVLDFLYGRLDLGPNESVLLYHSGHGSILVADQPYEGSLLLLNSGAKIRRADLRQALERQHPRALILLTDCCSSYFIYGRAVPEQSGWKPTTPALTWATVRNLLLRTRGQIDLTAAGPGTTASAGHDGFDTTGAQSAFTDALLRLWTDPSRVFTSWREFFPVLQEQTYEASAHHHRAYAFTLRELGTGQPAAGKPAPVHPGHKWSEPAAPARIALRALRARSQAAATDP
jgi:hypothetical protein